MKKKSTSPLTHRESALVNALIRGETRADYAMEAGLSLSTIANMTRVILAKLQARTMLHAIAILHAKHE
jgi:DNA-binding NarL/FixJ family response regulator